MAKMGAAWVLALTACSNANFKSSNAKEAKPETADLHCNADRTYSASDLQLQIHGGKDTDMILQGEFCPQAPAELDLVFLIDFSLSMYNAAESRGNDMVQAGSCGRLAAVKAIISRQAQNAADQGAKIQAGVVQFASNLVGTVPLTDLAGFAAEETVDNFCRGIDGTNYKIAFDQAAAMLKNETGTKVVYLISDGLPTEGGGGARENAPRHRDAAQAAADAMRASVKNLTFNTVFLGNVQDLTEVDFDPQQFLVKLTGSADRVKVVDKAENLAGEILTLEPPPVDLDTSTVKAVLSASGVQAQPVSLDFFKPDAVKDQVWSFRTVEFAAFPGAKLESTLTISAADKQGQPYQLVFSIEPKATADKGAE